jgi:hypothetical protein
MKNRKDKDNRDIALQTPKKGQKRTSKTHTRPDRVKPDESETGPQGGFGQGTDTASETAQGYGKSKKK